MNHHTIGHFGVTDDRQHIALRPLNFHHAGTAITRHRQISLITKMLKRNIVLKRRFQNVNSVWHFHGFTVDGDLRHSFPQATVSGTETVFLINRFSKSSRNFLIKPRTGMARAEANTQIVLPSILSAVSSIKSKSFTVALPARIFFIRRSSQAVPSRQGVHWPQDSSA